MPFPHNHSTAPTQHVFKNTGSVLSMKHCCSRATLSGFAIRLYDLFFFFNFLIFLGPHPRHTEVPRPEVESELWRLTYAIATATSDPSWVCNLHHSSWQCWIPDPLSEGRNRTCILMDTRRICLCRTTMGTPGCMFLSEGPNCSMPHFPYL